MNAKTTTVTLVVPAHNMEQDFEFSHAERLLGMANNGGWQLPENSHYVFDNGSLIRRTNKKDNN